MAHGAASQGRHRMVGAIKGLSPVWQLLLATGFT